jgi:hypothetical protein
MKTFIGIALLSCGEKIMGEFVESINIIQIPHGLSVPETNTGI